MKAILASFLLAFNLIQALAQDTTLVLNTSMFEPKQDINLSSLDRWIYHEGNNINWAERNINAAEWQRLKPADLSVKYADKTGRAEGWFRLKFRLDSTFEGLPLAFDKNSWAAVDLYVDGQLIASFGNTGSNGETYQEHYPYYKPHWPVNLKPGQDYLIAIHLVDYVSPFSSKKLKSELEDSNKVLLYLSGPDSNAYWLSFCRSNPVYATLWMSISLIMTILFWLLSYQDLYEKK
ncbi:hypothetical protein [Dyadobacter sp. NIV53]|uniref:hypothetical protein n=1 Tax=Dyadobacter sp. NIV53 TaxID=2861765 RepID=UPI001C873580|nr:hypothetical protein [Dyadobacter sp. NIV53]